MTPEQAVRAYLLTVGAVTALTGQRIYQLKLPEKPTLPALRIQLIDEPKNYHLRGHDGATRARVQIDAYGSEAVSGDPYAAVTTLAAVVDDAIGGKVFTSEGLRLSGVFLASRRVGYEADTLRLVRCTHDFIAWVQVL